MEISTFGLLTANVRQAREWDSQFDLKLEKKDLHIIMKKIEFSMIYTMAMEYVKKKIVWYQNIENDSLGN